MNTAGQRGLGVNRNHQFNQSSTQPELLDFQRSNLFTLAFATNPTAKSRFILDGLGTGDIYNINTPGNDILGLMNGSTSLTDIGKRTLDSAIGGATRYVVGAMTERVMSSLFGDIKTGTYMMDYFNNRLKETGLTIYSVGLPNNTLGFEIDKNHNAPNIKINGREFSPLVLRFRVDKDAANLTAMNDWVNSVNDPVTQLSALPVDVESDIQVNLHNRQGLPVSTMMYVGCVPVDVSQPQLTYEDRSEIAVFEVTFAYRYAQIGKVPFSIADKWSINNIGAKVFSGSRIK